MVSVLEYARLHCSCKPFHVAGCNQLSTGRSSCLTFVHIGDAVTQGGGRGGKQAHPPKLSALSHDKGNKVYEAKSPQN